MELGNKFETTLFIIWSRKENNTCSKTIKVKLARIFMQTSNHRGDEKYHVYLTSWSNTLIIGKI
jgi:hypothetical protein